MSAAEWTERPGGWGAWRLVPRDERLVVVVRPDWAFVWLVPAGLVMAGAVVHGALVGAGVGDWLRGVAGVWEWRYWGVLAGLALAWAVARVVRRWAMLYVLTPRRVLRVAGVFHQTAVELPVSEVDAVVMDRTLVQRLLGLGTLVFVPAPGAGTECSWYMVARPEVLLAEARGELPGAVGGGSYGGGA